MEQKIKSLAPRVLIVGLGLIGGSYAQGLTARGYEVTAIDPDEEAIAYALSEKMIVDGSSFPEQHLISKAELIIFAVYPSMMLQWVEQYQHQFQESSIITDVCGIKGDLVRGMERILRDDVYYVGSHPMAGKAVSGVKHADYRIFRNGNFILTPTPRTNDYAIKVVERMAKDLDFFSISQLSPAEHDRSVGYLSQLTHVIAVSLMNCQENEDYIRYTGDSFRDLTRIANINENLWTELFMGNKEILLDEIDLFAKELQEFRKILAQEDVSAMKERFIQSTQRRKKYE